MTYGIKNKSLKEKAKSKTNYKTYFYKWGKHHTSKYGGQDETLEVYEMKKGDLVKVGEEFVETRAMKGFEGEAMNVLLKTGKISKEEFDKSQDETSGVGYYKNPDVWGSKKGHNFKIKSIGDMY